MDPSPSSDTHAEIARLTAELTRIRSAKLAHNTVKGYAYAWSIFERWCARMNCPAIPASPETVSLFLADQLATGKKVSTATHRTSAIAYQHRAGGYPSPATEEVRALLDGAQRLRGEQPRQMKAFTVKHIAAMSELFRQDGTPRALRNRAVIVVGFASALRRNSLAALALDDVEFTDQGLLVRVRREKQDQHGRGRVIGLPKGRRANICPVRTLRAWIKVRGREQGPLFCQIGSVQPWRGEAIHRAIKAAAARIGLDWENYGAHSLRAGFVTAAGEAGIGHLLIADHTGHHSLQMIARYFRRTDVWKHNVAGMLGL